MMSGKEDKKEVLLVGAKRGREGRWRERRERERGGVRDREALRERLAIFYKMTPNVSYMCMSRGLLNRI